jgi:hypothetical protein
MTPPAGAVAAVGALPGGVPSQFPTHRTSVRFLSPAGMKVSWFAPSPDGKTGFANNQLVAPGRYNFLQAAVYRLKLSSIPNRPGLELYPTLEVVPSNARTDAFLAHSAVPVAFTDEDFDQVASGNFLVKVVYLPYPQFQDLATIGPDEVVSSRLEPGVDPIAEACRRGNVLLVVRVGNIDLEAPNTPAMDAPSPFQLKGSMPHGMPGSAGMGAGMALPPGGPMVPYGFMNQGQPLKMGPNGPLVPPGELMAPPGGDHVLPPSAGPTSRAPADSNGSAAGQKTVIGASYSEQPSQQAPSSYAPITSDMSAPAEKKSWWARHWGTDNQGR